MEQINIGNRAHVFEEYDVCPFCHQGMKPIMLNNTHGDIISGKIQFFIITWRCPLKSCSELVITKYVFASVIKDHVLSYGFNGFFNGSPILPTWPEFIKTLKNGNPEDPSKPGVSKFQEIYSQSLSAEQRQLNEIAGIGFRRSLEFLIKDFAIQEHPEEK
jgi:hypothetical protein